MNQLQTCTDNLVKVILNQLQERINDEYYEEVRSIKSNLDKKELTLKEAGDRIRFMYETYTEEDFCDWIYELDRFTDSMEQILVCLKPVYETHRDFLEAQKIIDDIRMHSNFINKMLLMDLYQNYDEEDQS